MSIPTKTGFLTKLGAKFATWRRRYFVLAGTMLYYTKGEAEANRRRFLGEINLHEADIRIYSAEEQAEDPTLPTRDFLFTVKPKDSTRMYQICADNERNRAEWVLMLREHAKFKETEESKHLRKDPDSLREGYMTKLGEKVKNWKRRYFVLTANHLHYYRHIEDKEPAGSILLLGTKISREQRSIVGVQHAFSITTADGRRKYIIYGDTQEQCNAWVEATSARSTFSGGDDANDNAKDRVAELRQVVDAADAKEKVDHRLTDSLVEATSNVKEQKGNIKQKVSKKKRRFAMGGLDLDLTYITDRIIAMGFPSESLEAMYRNSMHDVQKFLAERHPDCARVYNLCSERWYDPAKFNGNVCRFPFDDHNCPNFEDLVPLCKDIDNWLTQNPDNVAVIHCKAGKGRTGLVICIYLLFSGAWERASEALSYYAFVRTKDQKGVTIPSQRRYVHYFERYMRDPEILTRDKPLVLNEIFISKGVKPFDCVEIKNRGNKLLSKDWGKYCEFWGSLALESQRPDINIFCFDRERDHYQRRHEFE